MTNALTKACEDTATTADKALAWASDAKNEGLIKPARPALERLLRSHAYQARRLARSVERPMCVGVFGPSQAGKSYLVSVLARKGSALTAVFDDPKQPEVDFISKINPYGDKEATGLVTRFSKYPTSTPKGFPVALRLLSQTDIVKILANAYFLEGDQQLEAAVSGEALAAHVAAFEALQRQDYADALREEDIWDVEEYFAKQLRRTETHVFGPYWDRIARCAPRLSLADRAELFSIFWGRHEPLTELFLKLLESLAALNFAEEAFCQLDALAPREVGILNVDTLSGLASPGADKVAIAASSGRATELPRPIVTALAAELRIVMKESPWPFLDYTDLLDFPGYLNRNQLDLDKHFREARDDTTILLFRRGKVDFLFQRYTFEQELTGMLLCIGPSNMTITSLPPVIDDWVRVTHGSTPAERRGRPTLLFFVLSKFDTHLVDKASDGEEGAGDGARFEARMQASLLVPFAKLPTSWPLRWTRDEPFRNCYWVRNPQIPAEGTIEYGADRQEVRIRAEKESRIAALRAACSRVPTVKEHFWEPERAFDEAMRLNDGGASYLAENLGKICAPDIKPNQVRGRLEGLRASLHAELSPYFVGADTAKRVEERTAAAEQVFEAFYDCVQDGKFSAFLRGLYVDRSALADTFYELGSRPARAPNGAEARPPRSNGAKRWWEERPVGDGKAKPGQSAAASDPVSTRTEALVRAAVQMWTRRLREAVDDNAFCARVELNSTTVRDVVAELLSTSRRLGLEEAIRAALAEVSYLGSVEEASAKATIVCERMINRFVSDLAMDAARPEPAFDANGLTKIDGAAPRDFAVRWLSALHDHFIANAQSADGLIEDVEQNARLGALLLALEKALPTGV